MVEGDGCALDCTIEKPGECPGTAIHLSLGETIQLKGTTAGASDKFIGSRTGIGNCGGANYTGPDLIYAVVSDMAGMVTAELDATYSQSFVRVRPGCPSAKNEEIRCDYIGGTGKTMITFAVTAGTTYHVAADSWSDESGPFTLTLSLKP